MKKWLKIWLIIWWFLIILWLTFILITKKFEVETLEKTHCWPDKNYDWKDEKCYKKCKKWCSYENCKVVWWNCYNACVLMCETPKYENCISKCKDLEVDWYDEQHYSERFSKNEIWSKDRHKYDERLKNANIGNIALPEEYKYDERIEDIFTWYKEEIEKYESCKSTCWEKPEIMLLN